MTDERKQPRQTCTAHCSACGNHFHGVSAFDAHRRAGDCVAPAIAMSTEGRVLLQIWTNDGVCTLENGPVREHVTVWQGADEKTGPPSHTCSRSAEEEPEAVSVQG